MEFIIFVLTCLIIIEIIIIYTLSFRVSNIEDIFQTYKESNNKLLEKVIEHSELQDKDLDYLLNKTK